MRASLGYVASAWSAVMLSMALLVATSCGDGGSPADSGGPPPTAVDATPELQAVIDAAEEEGHLDLSWAGILGDIEAAPQLIEGFKAHFGIDIDVSFTPGSGQSEMAATVEQEFNADLPASTDVLSFVGSAAFHRSQREGLLEPDWSFSSNITSEMVAPAGGGVIVQYWLLGIAYSTARVAEDEVPRTMEDLLDERYEGRIYTTPFVAGFDVLASDEVWGRERTIDYAEKFAEQVGGINFNVQPLLTGEFDIMALLVPPGLGARSARRRRADRLDRARGRRDRVPEPPRDPGQLRPPERRPALHRLPHEPGGPELLREIDYADSPLVDGSMTAEQMTEAEEAGAEIVVGDVAFFARQPDEEYQETKEELASIVVAGVG